MFESVFAFAAALVNPDLVQVDQYTGDYSYLWLDENGQPHSQGDHPSKVDYDCDGNVTGVYWDTHGVAHRDNGPAMVVCNRWDTMVSWYNNGELSREGGPARISYFGKGNRCTQMEWLRDGEMYRRGDLSTVVTTAANGVIVREEWLCEYGIKGTRKNGQPNVITYHSDGSLKSVEWRGPSRDEEYYETLGVDIDSLPAEEW